MSTPKVVSLNGVEFDVEAGAACEFFSREEFSDEFLRWFRDTTRAALVEHDPAHCTICGFGVNISASDFADPSSPTIPELAAAIQRQHPELDVSAGDDWLEMKNRSSFVLNDPGVVVFNGDREGGAE